MENQFEKIMSGKSNEELIVILNSDRKNYKTEAIEAAEKEYKTRNISEELIQTVKEEVEAEEIKSSEKATESLDPILKFFAFLLPGLIMFFFAEKYRVEGYTRKAKELSRSTLYGFCFYIGLIILASL